MKISILGCGAFGSAMASRLTTKGHTIVKENVEDSTIVIVAVPSFAVVDVLLLHKDEILDKKVVICSKGFDKDGSLLSTSLKKEFPNNKFYFLYGPTLSEELRDGIFSIMVLAGDEDKNDIEKELEMENFHIELSDDVVGVQIGAALKNVVAIFIGIVEGAGLGENAQAFIYSLGLQEIRKVGVHLGANPDTFLGFSCAGDLFLRSRNRNFGIEIGKGRTYEDVSNTINYPNEGITSLKNILKMKELSDLDLSFFKTIESVIFNEISPFDAIKKLINKV